MPACRRTWLAALTLLLALPLQAASSSRQTERELQSIKERIDKVSGELSRDAVEKDRLARNLRAAELSVGEARQQLARVQAEQAERAAQREQLAAQRDREQQLLVGERSSLASQLRVAYMLGQMEPLKLLLNQRDPAQAGRLFAYYGYFGRARAGQIAGIEQRIARIDQLDEELQTATTQLADLQRERETTVRQLEDRRKQRAQVLATLQRESQSRTQTLARLRSQQADLEKLLRELDRTLRNAPPPDTDTAFARLRGRLDWPVDGNLVAEFGDARAAGVRWEGVVVATARSAPVRAVSAGRVVYADWLPGLGLLTIIDHGEGYLSLYGYNDELRKPAGANVAAGEVIAAAGDSGGRTRPELYFEIRRAGKPVDPRPWFRRRSPG
jgi:septal ring factor EnvC (AmiA/AmiB activator)